MKLAMKGKVAFIAALLLISAFILPSAHGGITAVNNCSFALTVFTQNSAGRSSFSAQAGASVNLGIPGTWVGGVIWGSRTGNINNGQCTQLEFNINSAGRDYYDISVVNAYNVAAQITVPSANNDTPDGLECGSPKCSISDINSVCVRDNYFAGPDNACINRDGPGLTATPSIELWVNACPEAYTLSNNNTGVVYACNTGSNYNVVFCP